MQFTECSLHLLLWARDEHTEWSLNSSKNPFPSVECGIVTDESRRVVLNAALPLLLHNSQSAAVCLNTVHMNQPSHLRLAGSILTMPKVKFRGTKENWSILSTVKRPHRLQRGINRKINNNNIRLMKIFYVIFDIIFYIRSFSRSSTSRSFSRSST